MTDTKLLEPLETAVVPASPAPVVVRDCFKKNTRVRISTVYHEFKSRFFDKTENAPGELTYRKYRLLQISADAPIISELGGEARAGGPFVGAFLLLQRQPLGERGFLQTNGYANIFYAADKKGALCAVRIGWASDGWAVDAIAADDPLAWNGRHLIFQPVAP